MLGNNSQYFIFLNFLSDFEPIPVDTTNNRSSKPEDEKAEKKVEEAYPALEKGQETTSRNLTSTTDLTTPGFENTTPKENDDTIQQIEKLQKQGKKQIYKYANALVYFSSSTVFSFEI